jgi:7,8-dihydro-6-hydroxymethylpterin dimethyltransferase
MITDKLICKTQSLCPVCLRRIDAEIFSQGENTYLKKSCPSHGTFKTIIWKGSIPFEKWIIKKERAYIKNPLSDIKNGCPYDCGLCSEHRQHTCTALIEVTQNCNLHCSFCFADSNDCKKEDLTLQEIKHMYESVLKASGICNIQLSGGEPTIRNDLPSIIQMGKKLGFNFIQVNTNGIRMGEDEEFVKELKSAGLSSIFLQFDGTNDLIYKKLRGKELLQVKTKAIENCGKYGIGVVLVPTLVPKVNVENIGEIIYFALEHIHTVRGVHFQPVSYFGRVPNIPKDEDRITLSEVMEEIERQTGDKIKLESLKPPKCENSLCSFHGSFIYRGNGQLMSITNNSGCCGTSEKVKLKVKGCCSVEKAEVGADKAKEYVSRNWSSRKFNENNEKLNTGEISGWDKILDSIHSNSFSISAMAFQDAFNVNLERVKDCCIHVVSPEGKLIPFCLYNITNIDGSSLYRV